MDLHVVGATDDGKVVHTIRHSAPGATAFTWDKVGDVEVMTGDLPPKVVDAACALDAKGELHVVVVTDSGKLLHTIRRTTGLWEPFKDVGPWAGGVGVIKATAAASDGMDLHVLVATADGKLFHTIRHPKQPGATAFTWDRFQTIKDDAFPHGRIITLAGAGKSP